MRLRKRYLSFAAAFAATAIVLPTLASSASPTDTVQALAPYSWSPADASVNAGGSLAFKNESAINHGIIWTGGTAGATPTCNTQAGDDIPIGAGNWSTSWHGSCTFAKAGTYTYECSLHMALMRGTVTVSTPGAPVAVTAAATAVGETEATLAGTVDPDGLATGYFFEWGANGGFGEKTAELPVGEDHVSHAVSAALSGLSAGTTYDFRIVAKNSAGPASVGATQSFTTPSTPATPPATPTPPVATTATQPTAGGPAAPLPGPGASGAPLGGTPTLALTNAQRGNAVHGTIAVPASDADARLEVELLAPRASLTKVKRSSDTRVGHLLRSAVAAGKVSFTVALDAAAKRALHHHHKLTLAVRVVLTPPHGAQVTIARSISLHA